jgi:hypothetical protein
MFRVLPEPTISNTITAVDSHWYNICYVGSGHDLCGKIRLKSVHDQAVGHITMVELELV